MGNLLLPLLKPDDDTPDIFLDFESEGDQQDAVTKLQNDKHFRKDQKKVQAQQQRRKLDAEEMGAQENSKKAKKRNRNKYHHLGKKGDVKAKPAT